jgi:hypothetical protein
MLNSIEFCKAARKIEIWGQDENPGIGDVIFTYVANRRVNRKVGTIKRMIRSDFLSV